MGFWGVIDDLANRPHDCDVLLDQTYGRKEADYRAYVPSECTLLLGTQYSLLRPEFRDCRERALQKRDEVNTPTKVLVTFGASDPFSMSAFTIEALSQVTTPLNVHIISPLPEVSRMPLPSQHTFTFSPHVDRIWDEMSSADVAIGAAGTTSWERCALGLPSILVTTADNQELIAQNLDEAGAVIYLGKRQNVTQNMMADAINQLCENADMTHRISQNARKVCDGFGAERVAAVIEQ